MAMAVRGASPRAAAADRRVADRLRRLTNSSGGAACASLVAGRGGFRGRPDRSLILWVILALICIYLIGTSFHVVAPGERGVVTRLGRYSSTLGPGVGLTLPSPIDRVQKVNVENIRSVDLGSQSSEDLMLTGDQNLIDIAYSVRWNVRTPELYLFQLAQPDETIQQVAESTMRAVIAQVTLQQAMGDKRSEIETRVTDGMQHVLDGYHAGIDIQGVAIQQADPPAEVNDAFKEVTAAQQDAKSYVNQANAYALQLTARRKAKPRRSTRSTSSTSSRPRSLAGACTTRRWSRCSPRSTRRSSRRLE